MASTYDSDFSFHEQLWFFYSENRGKIRSRYNDLTRKFLSYNDKDENKNAFLRKFMNCLMTGGISETVFQKRPIIPTVSFVLAMH